MTKLDQFDYFTQMLWRSSKKVGIGCATANVHGQTIIYVVVNFDPPGNEKCGFKYNVLPNVNSLLYKKLKREIVSGKMEPDEVCAVKVVEVSVVMGG